MNPNSSSFSIAKRYFFLVSPAFFGSPKIASPGSKPSGRSFSRLALSAIKDKRRKALGYCSRSQKALSEGIYLMNLCMIFSLKLFLCLVRKTILG